MTTTDGIGVDPEDQPAVRGNEMDSEGEAPTAAAPIPGRSAPDPESAAQATPPGSPGRRRKPRSDAQRRASRRNGRRSGGPVTSEGKARSSGNATKHGGYASRPVVRSGVFRESARDYDRNRSAFLAVAKPVNPLAEQQAVRLFHEFRKLDRVDWFEVAAFEHAGRLPTPDPNFDDKVELALSRLDSATATLELWEDLLERYTDGGPEGLTWIDWESLWALAEDPALADLEAQMDQTEASAATHPVLPLTARSAIERSLTTQYGSVDSVLEARVAAADRTVRRRTAEFEALKEPPTEAEYGAQIAYQLLTEGFFDRLSRPRATSNRAIRQAWDQFTSFQQLGPAVEHEPDSEAPPAERPAR